MKKQLILILIISTGLSYSLQAKERSSQREKRAERQSSQQHKRAERGQPSREAPRRELQQRQPPQQVRHNEQRQNKRGTSTSENRTNEKRTNSPRHSESVTKKHTVQRSYNEQRPRRYTSHQQGHLTDKRIHREYIQKHKHRRHDARYRNQPVRYSNMHFRGQHRNSRWSAGHGHFHYDFNYRHIYNPYQWYDDYYYQSYFDWRWNRGNQWRFGYYYNDYNDPYYCPDGFAEFVTTLAVGALIYNW